MPQFLIKCVEDKMYDIPTKELHLSDFRGVVEQESDLAWGYQPRVGGLVQNSDGSTTRLDPKEGFFVKGAEDDFVVCYEHYRGIAVHSKEDSELVKRCLELAKTLGAKVFQIS